jgi:hypothetical protein
MATPLYFGPYNDPGDSQNLHHWDVGHDPDCHNPALTIGSTINPDQSKTISIQVSIRNIDQNNQYTDVIINLYAAVSGLLNSIADVTTLAGMVLTNPLTTGITPPAWTPQTVRPYSATVDNVVVLGPVSWTVPAYANGFIVIATLDSNNANEHPTAQYTQDPAIGIWLG